MITVGSWLFLLFHVVLCGSLGFLIVFGYSCGFWCVLGVICDTFLVPSGYF